MLRSLLAPVLVGLAALLATAPAIHGSFVYDDEHYVVGNDAVSAEASPWTMPLGEASQALWRPLTVASFRWQWDGSADPRPFLVVNVLLHVLTSVLVLGLGRKLGLGRTASLMAGLLFAVHPVHAESVAWVTGRAELLAAAFVLAAWVLHQTPGRTAVAGSAILLALACLSKENALVAPALFLVADLALERRPRPLARLAILAAVALTMLGLRLAVLPHALPTQGPYLDTSPAGRAIVATNVGGYALRLLLIPHPLRIDYHRDEFVLARPEALLALAAVVVIALSWRRHRRAALALALVPVALVPVLHLVPIGEPFAERFLYLPSAPFCLALGALLAARARREITRQGALGASVAVFVAMLAIAVPSARSAVRILRDDLTLWSHAASVAPHLAMARYNHAAQLDAAGRHLTEGRERPGCEDEFLASLALEPLHVYAAFAHQSLGHHALGLQGTSPPDATAAARHYRRAIELMPGLASARISLASLAVSARQAVSRLEAVDVLRPLAEQSGLPIEERLAVEEILRQVSASESSEESTGTSSPDGS